MIKHNYLENMPLSEANKKFFELLKKNSFTYKTEKVKTALASGRVLSCAQYAKICSPHYNASAMDGIALKSSLTYGAAENTPVTIKKEDYTIVDTGDPIPETADSVIMVEDVSENEDGSVRIYAPSKPWGNIRQIGEDLCMGDMIAPSYAEITPSLCGALLAGGITEIEVLKTPVFAIIPTGDEIVSPTSNPEKGDIIEFNSAVFASMLKNMGAASKIYPIVPDKKDVIKASVEKAVNECDAVIIIAGSSAGRDDYTCEIISSVGETAVHGIAIKPGKPAVLGAAGPVPLIGLPGYPVSAIVIMEKTVKPLIDMYYHRGISAFPEVKAVLGKKVISSLKYREFVRVTLGNTGDKLTAVPLPRGAGVITSFTKADGILEIPQNSEGYDSGEKVKIKLLKDINKINSALIVTGSHDPIIDEISDILKKQGYNFPVTSSHVGSMGAITAIKNGSAHLGGIHLLDPATGKYNEKYIKEYFPNGGVRLIKGVKRIQGLMVAKGNPLGIKDFSDIARVRYINRQGGSGTRILCDSLADKYGIDKRKVEGYYNEEFTHTAVAAGIKNGNADAGLGIYSAAKMYDLDFIEICLEEYDFLVDEKAMENENVKHFLDVLESPEFARRIEAMGGYRR